MHAADVPTIREILADYIDVEDPYYATMIDALADRELTLRQDAKPAVEGRCAPRPRF